LAWNKSEFLKAREREREREREGNIQLAPPREGGREGGVRIADDIFFFACRITV
jgi:hypothetical protein